MMTLVLLRNTLLALHLLSAVVWVGGMAFTVFILRPTFELLEPTPRLQMHQQTLKRFFRLTWHVLPILLLTGWAMVFAAWGGFAMLPWSINVMQTLALIMTFVFLYTYFVPFKRLQRAIRPTPEMLGRIRQFVTLNLVLGTITIIAGSLGHVW
jgi:uncharacterized membrane protein